MAFQDDGLIQYKAEVMLRIFEKDVMPLIDGRAKAMIVTTSRIAGLRYFEIIKEKLVARGDAIRPRKFRLTLHGVVEFPPPSKRPWGAGGYAYTSMLYTVQFLSQRLPTGLCQIVQGVRVPVLVIANGFPRLGPTPSWQEALEKIADTRQMDATAIRDYFAPLQKWLDEQNRGQPVGW